MTYLRAAIGQAIALGLAAVPAFAQIADENVKQINIDPMPLDRAILEYALAGAFILAALGVGFKSSKRVADT